MIASAASSVREVLPVGVIPHEAEGYHCEEQAPSQNHQGGPDSDQAVMEEAGIWLHEIAANKCFSTGLTDVLGQTSQEVNTPNMSQTQNSAMGPESKIQKLVQLCGLNHGFFFTFPSNSDVSGV
ncbi:hypothetical protein FRX31_010745 [Thalictrum thalictroides]|uniref:Uncharacterized protein n=1 Tax=Thalictrum thalictroides TaxID=46969 RepID=A0A7J6WS42_THATH|nr:hypothetical protein FRX31_010745 [Thalictrum thalictroides]